MLCKIKPSCCWHTPSLFVDNKVDIQLWGNLRINTTVNESFVVLMLFFSIQAKLIQDYTISHNTFSLIMWEHIIHYYNPHNPFGSQQTHVISWVDIVMYHWLDRILTSHPFSNLTDNWTWNGLVHISAGMTQDSWYFETKRPLSNYSCKKSSGM